MADACQAHRFWMRCSFCVSGRKRRVAAVGHMCYNEQVPIMLWEGWITMTRLLPWLRGAVAAMTLLLAALLCWQCIDIYAAGNAPENLTADGVHIEQVYRADNVGARLTTLAIPAAAYAVLIAVTAIVQHRAPEKPEASAMTAENRLRLMKRRVALIKPIQEKVFAAIEAYAKQTGAEVVIDSSNNPTLLYTAPSAERTDEVNKSLK